MTKEELNNLITELNELSTLGELKKDRMVEIAKILLTEHYGYKRKDKSEEKQ